MVVALSFADMMAHCGIAQETEQYLQARGIRTDSVLVLIAADVVTFEDKVVKKFMDRHMVAGTEHKNTNDEDVVRATMIAAWQTAKREHESQFMNATTNQNQAQPAAVPTPTTSTKVPNTLPHGVWSTQVRRYNQIQSGNKNRRSQKHRRLESIRWCWILFEIGTVDAVNKYIEF